MFWTSQPLCFEPIPSELSVNLCHSLCLWFNLACCISEKNNVGKPTAAILISEKCRPGHWGNAIQHWTGGTSTRECSKGILGFQWILLGCLSKAGEQSSRCCQHLNVYGSNTSWSKEIWPCHAAVSRVSKNWNEIMRKICSWSCHHSEQDWKLLSWAGWFGDSHQHLQKWSWSGMCCTPTWLYQYYYDSY